MGFAIRLLLAVFLAACSAASAAPPYEVLATFIDDRTAAVCRVRLDGVNVDKLQATLGDASHPAAAYGPWMASLRKAGARDLFVIASLDDLSTGPMQSAAPTALVPLGETMDAQAIGALLCGGPAKGGPRSWTTCASIRGAVLAGDDAGLERARGLKPISRPELFAALDDAADAPIVLAAAIPADLRRAMEELVPTLPIELGEGPSSLVSRGLKWASASFRQAESPNFRIVVKVEDASTATGLAALAGKAVKWMRASTGIAALVPRFEELSGSLKVRIEGDRIVSELPGEAGMAWFHAIVDPAVESSSRLRCVDNLKQLGLGMHNYHAANGSFPPAYKVDADGSPLLSWRVLILPYLDQGALYKEFHLDEPWDSPHNKPLAARMPEVFACPSKHGGEVVPGATIYKTPRGPKTGFPGPVGIRLKDVTDGTSNTIMIVETPAAQAVIWTKPDDWDVQGTLDPRTFLVRHVGGAETSFMDGSVRFLRETMKRETLNALLTPAGGEVISDEDR